MRSAANVTRDLTGDAVAGQDCKMNTISRSPRWSTTPAPAYAGWRRRTWKRCGSRRLGVISDGDRASEIIGRIGSLATKASPRRDLVDINETLGEALVLA
jgi:hypothetical protein